MKKSIVWIKAGTSEKYKIINWATHYVVIENIKTRKQSEIHRVEFRKKYIQNKD